MWQENYRRNAEAILATIFYKHNIQLIVSSCNIIVRTFDEIPQLNLCLINNSLVTNLN